MSEEAVPDTAGTTAQAARPDGRPAPYRHDPGLVPALARLADAACEGVTDPHEASMCVEALAAQADPPVDRSAALVLFHTFLYIIKTEPVEAPQPGASLNPLNGPSLLPTALRDAGEDINQLWLALAGEVAHPVARARCWDIVFTLRLIPNGRDSAEQAARAYLETINTTLAPRHQANGLLRAWTMARQVGLADLTQEATTVMIGVVEDVLAREEDPYAAIPLLGALIAPAPRGNPAPAANPKVDDLLDRALGTYPAVHVIKDIAALVRKRADCDTARIEHANRHEVGSMLAKAEAATEPIVIRTLFNDAASTARRLGLADLEKIAIAKLQAAPTLIWEATRFETTIPAGFFDLYLPGFNEATDWRQALAIWLHTDSPSGCRETNEATARQVQQVSVLRYLVTTIVFRDGDFPARTLSSEDDVFKRDLARVEAQYISMYGTFLAHALYMIQSRFGIPSREDLEAFLLGSGAASTLVKALTTALQLYWVEEYEASTHLAVPKIEAAARALLLELNEPVYRAAIGDATGQFPGLGSLLLELLNNDFDPNWERFLRTFLLGEGFNVRNLVAHGFADTVDPINAALALRASAVLILLTTEEAVHRYAATVKAALATPHGTRPRRRWGQRIKAVFWAARRELWQ